jgi:hypothetical protein
MTTATLALTRLAVRIPAAAAMLEAEIVVPPQARGLVLSAQPIASCRHSLGNCGTAEAFSDVSMATMLPEETKETRPRTEEN